MPDLSRLPTPSLLLERDRLEANVARMASRARELGVRLRPHLKTSKCADVARIATAGQFGGITVSTLREADHFLSSGFRDMTYAVGIAPGKLDEAAALMDRGADLGILVDEVETARAIAAHGHAFTVHIEIDTGGERGGIFADDPALPEIVRALGANPAVEIRGVLAHAGHSYGASDLAGVEKIAEEERAGAVAGARVVRALGHECPVVSVGSTPTALHARHLEGVNEMRPGVYMFGDLFQAGIGSCGFDDLAISVLATVIHHRRKENRVLVDAGGLALSKDRSTAKLPRDLGYGVVMDAPDLVVADVHQEHGIIESDSPIDFDAYPIGSRVRILPNHVCMTSAAYDRYHVIEKGEISGEWMRVNGW
jgi:D-serine deaminase-like pyridoxal phosphate-dependent protein